jgi:hypothetical protein
VGIIGVASFCLSSVLRPFHGPQPNIRPMKRNSPPPLTPLTPPQATPPTPTSAPLPPPADAAAYAAHSVNDPANANANASRAATAAANAYVYYANDAEEAFDALWSTISTDATFRERGRTASKIAGLPLWPNNQPDDLESSWQEMKNVLHGANEDWQVWTTWYDDRLAGRVQEEERELAYVRIDDNLWLEGPGIVNAEIKRRIEELEPSPPLIEAIPEQVSFVEELIGVVVKGARACSQKSTDTSRSDRKSSFSAVVRMEFERYDFCRLRNPELAGFPVSRRRTRPRKSSRSMPRPGS